MAGDRVAEITEDEAELYDRQIRLWGLDAQRRLRAACILVIGMRGLGAEVVKNVVLSGVKELVMLDHTIATDEDITSQFLIAREDIGKNRASSSLKRTQDLNPMVTVSADEDNVDSKDDAFFQRFHVICAMCCSRQTLIKLNDLCHKNNIQFFAGDVFGFYGYSFTDLNKHDFVVEVKKKVKPQKDGDEPPAKKPKEAEEETIIKKKEMEFTRLAKALSADWEGKPLRRAPKVFFILQVLMHFQEKYGRLPSPKENKSDQEKIIEIKDTVLDSLHVKRDFLTDDFKSLCFGELSPVCAVVGGMLAQEVIKAISQKDTPLDNFFFFDGIECCGIVDKIGY